ncbi:MAG: PsbP-related protein [Candidatus Paceibacterota bacterium]
MKKVLIISIVFSLLIVGSVSATTTVITSPSAKSTITQNYGGYTREQLIALLLRLIEQIKTDNAKKIKDWKTYTNNQYGFEVKYPSSWIIAKESAGYIALADEEEVKTKEGIEAGEGYCRMEFTSYNNNNSLPLYDWAISKFGKVEKLESGKIETIKVNGLNAIKYEFMDMGITTHILLQKSNKIIDIYAHLTECKNINTNFNQILSTFKFIDEDTKKAFSTTETEWKTYINNDFGFEFKYPTYTFAQKGEPEISVSNCDGVSCSEGKSNWRKKVVIINGNTYCLSEYGEAAAGTHWNTYNYSIAKNNKCINISFTIKSSCGGYEGSQYDECTKREPNLVNEITSSFKFTK